MHPFFYLSDTYFISFCSNEKMIVALLLYINHSSYHKSLFFFFFVLLYYYMSLGMERLIEQFHAIVREFRLKRHDLLDYHNNKFDRDYVEFNVKVRIFIL